MINVNNIGNSSHSGPRNRLGVNAIDVDIVPYHHEFPRIVLNSKEIEYASKAGMPIINSPFQFVKQIRKFSEIRNYTTRTETTNQYRSLLTKMNGVGDFYLQFPQRFSPTDRDRTLIHEIQKNAGSTILTDYELDRYQTAREFEQQILELKRQNPNYDISPTIDIRIEDENLFGEKVAVVLKNGFKRFNVIYGSIPENFANWIDLTSKIYTKNIWCNVVNVLPRWQRKKKISQISRIFLFGVHTVSLGLAWSGVPNAPTHTFDPRTHRFVLMTSGMTYVEGRAEAVVQQARENTIARRHIINGTYFTNYVMTRSGLRDSLISIA